MSNVTDRLAAALADRYRIERELGQGGMATVYLAEDLKHKRKVALKVLKPELAAVLGAERFVQEITTTAALQHPHILPLFDSGTSDGFLYYVMPFIQGETLRDRLNRETQLGVDEAVKIATDVADALHYAHTQGVIHRDIKPENILLANGRPMVADFGIALAVSAAAGGRMTETGLSLGTPHYMSPEQATAEREITARSDVYSLASVLYEMLAGQPPHLGGSAQQIIMKIIAEPVDAVTRYRKTVPPNVVAALAKALEKLPADRFTSAQAFGEALANSSFTLGATPGLAFAPHGARWKQRAAVPLGVAAILLLVAAVWPWTRREAPAPVTRLDLALGAATPLPSSDVVISPDGSMLAFVGIVGTESPVIYLRRLDGDPDFRKVPGTEGANASPTFSPDNQSIAFRRGQAGEGGLLTVDLSGGGATTIVRTVGIASYLHWGTQDQIVYSGGPAGLFRVAAEGGTPEFLSKTAGAARYSFLLPDGSGVLFSTDNGVSVLDFKTDSATVLVANAVHPTYVETGHLLYIAESGGLFARPFDLRTHRLTGAPVRVLDHVAAATGQRGYAVSRNGVLVYREGASNLASGATVPNRLAIMDFAGKAEPLPLPSSRSEAPRFSRNGRTIAYEHWTNRPGNESDIHTFDLITGTDMRVTFAGDNDDPIWAPDGKQIVFSKLVDGSGEDLFVKPADNSGTERSLLALPGDQSPVTFLEDGTILFMSRATATVQYDIYSYSQKGGGKPQVYLDAPWNEMDAQVSPDRKLAAFTSFEGGATDIWIRDFPVAHGKWQVSSSGGQAPRWSPDGQYVYFWRRVALSGDSLFRVRVERTPAIVVRAPEFLLAAAISISPRNWDLHPDGKRFVVAVPDVTPPSAASTGGSAPLSRHLVVLNWFAQLRAVTAKAQK